MANRTSPQTERVIAALRRLRFTAPELSELLGLPCSTVSAVCSAVGDGQARAASDWRRRVRYERQRPGELIHIDVKKLGRIHGGAGKRITGRERNARRPRDRRRRRAPDAVGWDAVHIAIDDATRLAYAEVLPDEKASTAIAFLRRAVAFYATYGINVERVLTDNGSPYISTAHAIACRTLDIRHLRTRPYRPQTNGKAERFIRTLLAGWAYGAIYASSRERTQALDGWLCHYNQAPAGAARRARRGARRRGRGCRRPPGGGAPPRPSVSPAAVAARPSA